MFVKNVRNTTVLPNQRMQASSKNSIRKLTRKDPRGRLPFIALPPRRRPFRRADRLRPQKYRPAAIRSAPGRCPTIRSRYLIGVVSQPLAIAAGVRRVFGAQSGRYSRSIQASAELGPTDTPFASGSKPSSSTSRPGKVYLW